MLKNSANGIFLDGELRQNVLYYFLLLRNFLLKKTKQEMHGLFLKEEFDIRIKKMNKCK
jgi:hypothetical protein